MEGLGRIILLLAWLGVIAGAAVGGTFVVFALTGAESAPQEAAGAAIGIAIAVIPYVIARAMSGIGTVISS